MASFYTTPITSYTLPPTTSYGFPSTTPVLTTSIPSFPSQYISTSTSTPIASAFAPTTTYAPLTTFTQSPLSLGFPAGPILNGTPVIPEKLQSEEPLKKEGNGIDAIQKGWFSELSDFWPGQAMSLEVEEVLMNEKSDFQDILVFKSKAWGTVFALDGAIQVTDNDEFSYHENIAHIPMFSHKCPKQVLIIGGGDGGAMREVLKHPELQQVTLVDIDKAVPEVSKKFFPKLSHAFDHPKANAMVGDGLAYIADKENAYDVIIVDSSDPDGPASTLFGVEFFTHCKNALKEGGILCTQAENMWIHLELIKSMKKFIGETGFDVEYCNIAMPSYPSGSIGFFLCRKDGGSCAAPCRPIPGDFEATLTYYDEDMHKAAFMLPRFVKNALQM